MSGSAARQRLLPARAAVRGCTTTYYRRCTDDSDDGRLGGAMAEITMPHLGESVTEGTIGRWLKQPGERVEQDEPLVEVTTDKVNTEMPAPFGGVLASDHRAGRGDGRGWRPDRHDHGGGEAEAEAVPAPAPVTNQDAGEAGGPTSDASNGNTEMNGATAAPHEQPTRRGNARRGRGRATPVYTGCPAPRGAARDRRHRVGARPRHRPRRTGQQARPAALH